MAADAPVDPGFVWIDLAPGQSGGVQCVVCRRWFERYLGTVDPAGVGVAAGRGTVVYACFPFCFQDAQTFIARQSVDGQPTR